MIDKLTLAEIDLRRAQCEATAERLRGHWRAAVPTSPRSARLGREVRQWAARAESWASVLQLAGAANEADAEDAAHPLRMVQVSAPHPYGGPATVVSVPGMPLDLSPELEDAAHAAGLTPGELLLTPKALHYCERPGCGHGDNVHGPFCFAAGCTCADWKWDR